MYSNDALTRTSKLVNSLRSGSLFVATLQIIPNLQC